jgi:hypothetical protein
MTDFVDEDNDMVATLRDNRHDEAQVHEYDIFTTETSHPNHDFTIPHSPRSESAFATSDLWCEPISIDRTNDNSDFSDDMQEPHSEDDIDGEHSSDAEDNAQLLLDNNAPLNGLTKFLSEWASSSRCSESSMTHLMTGLRELNCSGGYFLPQHFKSVRFYHSMIGGDAVNGVRKVLELCGNCWLHELDKDALSSVSTCVECRVPTVVCGYHRCRSRIIVSSLMGSRSPFNLPRCPVCEVSTKTVKTRRRPTS